MYDIIVYRGHHPDPDLVTCDLLSVLPSQDSDHTPVGRDFLGRILAMPRQPVSYLRYFLYIMFGGWFRNSFMRLKCLACKSIFLPFCLASTLRLCYFVAHWWLRMLIRYSIKILKQLSPFLIGILKSGSATNPTARNSNASVADLCHHTFATITRHQAFATSTDMMVAASFDHEEVGLLVKPVGGAFTKIFLFVAQSAWYHCRTPEAFNSCFSWKIRCLQDEDVFFIMYTYSKVNFWLKCEYLSGNGDITWIWYVLWLGWELRVDSCKSAREVCEFQRGLGPKMNETFRHRHRWFPILRWRDHSPSFQLVLPKHHFHSWYLGVLTQYISISYLIKKVFLPSHPMTVFKEASQLLVQTPPSWNDGLMERWRLKRVAGIYNWWMFQPVIR